MHLSTKHSCSYIYIINIVLKGTLELMSETIFGNWKPFKYDKKCFLFHLKSAFVHKIFGHVGKWLDKKTKVNFKIYDLPAWETNNYNTHIGQYLKE